MRKIKLLGFFLVPIAALGLLVANVASAETNNETNNLSTATRTNMMRYSHNRGLATSTRYKMMQGKNRPKTPIISGNGQPIVGGTVASISVNTLTITNASNVTYTVDISSAKVVKGNATSTISNIIVGDRVIVQGTVNGTSITASSVVDQGTMPNNNATSTPQNNGGFFGAIGGFFHRMFGFF
jgi:hypothetical protein